MRSFIYKSITLVGQMILVLSLVSCATTATIQALNKTGNVDGNVKIYLDGVHKGNGQIKHSYDFATAFTPTTVELRKEGCKGVQNNVFLNRLWPYFAGAFVLVLGIDTLYTHLAPPAEPYDFDPMGANGVVNAVLLSMVASGIGLASLDNPLYSYQFQCKQSANSVATPVVDKSQSGENKGEKTQ